MNKYRSISNLLKFIVLFNLFLHNTQPAVCQGTDSKKNIRQANASFDKGEFATALPVYLKYAAEFEPGAISRNELNFRIGFCYFNSLTETEKAIPWFEKYLARTDSIHDVYYFLARSYHLHNRFEEAIRQYEKFREIVEQDQEISPDIIEKVLASVNRDIERCNYGKVLINNPIDVIIENLGEDVNTTWSEYAPVISPDESKLVFTKRSPQTTGAKLSPDGDYYEDIYISDVVEGSLFKAPDYDTLKGAGFYNLLANFKFSAPNPISPNINSKIHEGAIQFSYDGSLLYIYRDFNVWVSELINGEWSVPKSLGELSKILSPKAYEPSVSVSINGDAIYFSSDRPGGYGGLDLYKSVRQADGSWSQPENLGHEINSPYDEDSPYIDPDGRTLYFSSNGHSSMGGFDVFKTVYKHGVWSQPQNFGYPVNSAGDDIFFMMTPRYNRGYYSSNRPGSYGKMDLYRLTFAKERPPLAEIRGLVLKGDTLIPAYSKISIYDPKTGDEISTHYSDSISGEYLLLFAHGHGYKVKVETDGFAPYQKGFNIPDQIKYYQYYQEIHHVYLRDRLGNIIGQKITMYNATFDSDSAGMDTVIFAKNSAGSIAKLLHQLKESNQLEVEEMADVKFYITRDSLMELKRQNPELQLDFPDKTTVSFLDTSVSKDISVLEAFVSVDAQSLILTPATTEKELEVALKPEDKEVSIPSILLYFDYEKENLRQEAKEKLNGFIEFLKNNPEMQFEVIGHTDSKGTDEFNIKLSLKRARSVISYLAKSGIASDRLQLIGKGESEPVAPNMFEDGTDNPEGRSLNRRVEFKLVK